MVDWQLLASGRDADVFAISAQRVLRRYRTGGDTAAEAYVMRYLAALGFPVPTVFSNEGPDLVMERLYGPTLLEALVAEDIDAVDAAALLADLHRQLHALPARVSTDADARILHLDLHPDNVVLSTRGPVVIDWRNAAEGPADLDVALSALILAQVAADETALLASVAMTLLADFLRNVGGRPETMLSTAAAVRCCDPGLTADESGNLDRAALLLSRTISTAQH
jgi:aminoglycoside phosphotransferase (APT) family kinase protein